MHKQHTSKGRRAVQLPDHQPRRAHRDRAPAKRISRAGRRPPQRKLRPRTAAEFDRLLASEGMPAELEDLPLEWTVFEPSNDGMVHGDPLERAPGQAAAQAALDGATSRGAFVEIRAVLETRGELTRRERAVLFRFAAGLGRPAIARELGLTEDQVRWSLERVRVRFSLHFCGLFANG